MEQGWLSAEQVAERLGLHVRTIRGYIRDGRLRAVRLGKQYRIAPADLDAFTGRPPDAARLTGVGPLAGVARPRAEVSAVVEVDGIAASAADRLGTLLVAGAQRPHGAEPLRIRTVYDDARARLKVIILGGVADAAGVLGTIDDVLETVLAQRDDPAVCHA